MTTKIATAADRGRRMILESQGPKHGEGGIHSNAKRIRAPGRRGADYEQWVARRCDVLPWSSISLISNFISRK